MRKVQMESSGIKVPDHYCTKITAVLVKRGKHHQVEGIHNKRVDLLEIIE
jgi:hypothetical protein